MDNTLHLAADQWATLERGEPLRLIVAERKAEVVVLRADQFDRLRQSYQVADGTTIVEEMHPLLSELDPNGWEDASNYDLNAK